MKTAVTLSAVMISMTALLVLGLGSGLHGAQSGLPGARWRTAWATSQQAAGTTPISNTTVRLIARVSIGGDAVRIRLDNTYGKSPLRVGAAHVGLRSRGAAIAAGSTRPILFAGESSVTVPPGGTVRSDAVPLGVMALQDLAVSLYVPDTHAQPSQHSNAVVTSYVAAANAGDVSSAASADAFKEPITSMPWLKAIDVRSSSAGGAIVAFGDSITDGTCTTLDAHDRWEDWLAVRLALEDDRHGGRNAQKAVVNEGIGGNTVTREALQPPPDSTPGIERLERDVLSHEGVTDVVLFMGTNDVRRGASAAQVIAGLSQIAETGQGARAQDLRRHDDPAAQRAPDGNEHRLERREDRDPP